MKQVFSWYIDSIWEILDGFRWNGFEDNSSPSNVLYDMTILQTGDFPIDHLRQIRDDIS